MWLFLLFVAVPIIEIALFIQVGGAIGLLPTLSIVVLTAVVGTWLMRAQGVAALQKLQSSLQTGQNPADPIANGAFILVAGILLLTPGFFTDSLGIALLIPRLRQAIIKMIAARIASGATVFTASSHGNGGFKTGYPASKTVVDADFEVVGDNKNTKPGDSGWTKPQ